VILDGLVRPQHLIHPVYLRLRYLEPLRFLGPFLLTGRDIHVEPVKFLPPVKLFIRHFHLRIEHFLLLLPVLLPLNHIEYPADGSPGNRAKNIANDGNGRTRSPTDSRTRSCPATTGCTTGSTTERRQCGLRRI
jgi:hypothetical protein